MSKLTDFELMHEALEFRKGILGSSTSALMCFAVCAPLQAYFSVCCGIETELEEADFGFANHFWLRLDDGRILDPTADQFGEEANLPAVYIGQMPAPYAQWIADAKAEAARP